jgi:hypothetical protein
MPFVWNGFSFRSAGFSVKGADKSNLASLEVREISAHLNGWELWRGKWIIDQIHAEKVDALIERKTEEAEKKAKSAKHPPGFKLASLLPSELIIENIRIGQANLRWQTTHGETGQLTAIGLNARRKDADHWEIETTGGRVQHAMYPTLNLNRAHALVSQQAIIIQDASAQLVDGGEIRLNGKIEHQLGAQLSGDISNVGLVHLLPVNFLLAGNTSGHLDYAGNLDRFESSKVTGSLKVSDTRIDLTNLFGKLGQLA